MLKKAGDTKSGFTVFLKEKNSVKYLYECNGSFFPKGFYFNSVSLLKIIVIFQSFTFKFIKIPDENISGPTNLSKVLTILEIPILKFISFTAVGLFSAFVFFIQEINQTIFDIKDVMIGATIIFSAIFTLSFYFSSINKLIVKLDVILNYCWFAIKDYAVIEKKYSEFLKFAGESYSKGKVLSLDGVSSERQREIIHIQIAEDFMDVEW